MGRPDGAATRRSHPQPARYVGAMVADGILPLESGELDLARGVVRRADGVTQLTLHQLDLLRYLAARPGQAVSRDEILREAWGWRGAVVRSRAADFAVLRIRAVIERDPRRPRHLLAEAGAGYRFEPLPAGATPVVLVQPAGAGYDPSWYVPRGDVEAEASSRLVLPGAPLVFTAPRGFGKTWAVQHVLAGGVGEADAGVEVDLDAVDDATLGSTDAVAAHLGLTLSEVVDGGEAAWEAALRGPGNAFHRLGRFLEREVLPRVPGRLVMVLDHADRLRRVPGGASVFGLLRAWAGRTRAPWDRLRLVLAVSTEPALLVDAAISPFNLSVPLALPAFARAEVARMVERHGLADAWVDPIWRRTGGHPSLARQACHAAAAGRLGVEGLETGVAEAVFGEHLRSRLVRVQARPELAAAVRSVLAGATPDPVAAERLVAAGVLRRADDGWAMQNPLYADHFAGKV